MFEIIQSETFQRWLSGLKDRQAVARIHARLDRAAGGNLGDVKPARDGVSEMRIDYGPGYRLYFSGVGRWSLFCWLAVINAPRMRILTVCSKLRRIGAIKS